MLKNSNIYTDKTSGFDSNNNKKILWELMIENGTFQGLPNSYLQNVKKKFDDLVEKNDSLQGTTTDKNKKVLIEITGFIKSIKEKILNENAGDDKPLVTYSEISAKRIDDFDNKLTQRQEEFDNMVRSHVPKQIDFSDKTDNPFNGNMESILNDTIAKRKNDLNFIKKNIEKQGVSPKILLKVGKKIDKPDITNIPIVKEKHVSFIDTNEENENKLDKLLELLQKIEANQNKIYEILSTSS